MIQKSPGVSRRKLGHRNDHQPRLNMCHQVQSALRLGAGGGAGTVLCTLPRGMRKVACSAWKLTASVLYYENFFAQLNEANSLTGPGFWNLQNL